MAALKRRRPILNIKAGVVGRSILSIKAGVVGRRMRRQVGATRYIIYISVVLAHVRKLVLVEL